MICPNVNVSGIDANASKLTAIDTLNGNGKLLGANGSGDKEYKIGLITTDEFIFAGGRIYTWSTSVTETNTTLYLYANATSGWWTMSPSTNNSSNGSRYVYTFNVEDGRLAGTITNTSLYLRPMISLISTIQISSGTGTYLEPYRIIVN